MVNTRAYGGRTEGKYKENVVETICAWQGGIQPLAHNYTVVSAYSFLILFDNCVTYKYNFNKILLLFLVKNSLHVSLHV